MESQSSNGDLCTNIREVFAQFASESHSDDDSWWWTTSTPQELAAKLGALFALSHATSGSLQSIRTEDSFGRRQITLTIRLLSDSLE